MRCSGKNGSYKQEWKGQQERRAGVEVKGGYEWLKKRNTVIWNELPWKLQWESLLTQALAIP